MMPEGNEDYVDPSTAGCRPFCVQGTPFEEDRAAHLLICKHLCNEDHGHEVAVQRERHIVDAHIAVISLMPPPVISHRIIINKQCLHL